MISPSPGPADVPAALARWLNEDALQALETLLGRTLACLELYELQKEECLSIAGAFGLPSPVRLAAGKRLQEVVKRAEMARESVRELRVRVDTIRRQLGMYRPPPPVEQEVSPARQRAARLVVLDLLQTAERELSADQPTCSSDGPKLQNEPRTDEIEEEDCEDELDWTQ